MPVTSCLLKIFVTALTECNADATMVSSNNVTAVTCTVRRHDNLELSPILLVNENQSTKLAKKLGIITLSAG
jgi:hypothetical protein